MYCIHVAIFYGTKWLSIDQDSEHVVKNCHDHDLRFDWASIIQSRNVIV